MKLLELLQTLGEDENFEIKTPKYLSSQGSISDLIQHIDLLQKDVVCITAEASTIIIDLRSE